MGMRKPAELRQHAAECRAMARTIQKEDYREQLLKMAEIWESLAAESERMQRVRGSIDEL